MKHRSDANHEMDPPTPHENDDQPEALDADTSEAKPSSIAGFLAAAIEHDFIKQVEISRIQSYVTSNNVSPSDAALNLAVLASSEVEAIKLLGEP